MDSKWLWVCIVLMLVSLEGWCSEGCWEQERFALLKLKHLLSSEFNNLENWVENSECCEWERVECNNKTGRVIKLDLGGLRRLEYLNLSLFSPFQQLESLDLSSNNRIAGVATSEGFERRSGLSNLTFLSLGYNFFNNSQLQGSVNFQDFNNLEFPDLSGNFLNNSVLSSVAKLPSLKTLKLGRNILKGAIDLQGLNYLTKLEVLDMSGNEIDKFVLSNDFNNLKVLDLSENILDKSILSSLANLSSLKALYLSGNKLKGVVDLRGLHNLSNLEELDMSSNEIDKFVLSNKSDSFSNLQMLDISGNIIDNFEVPKDHTGFRKLVALYLGGITSNNGSALLESLGSFPLLNTIDLKYSILYGSLTTTQELQNSTSVKFLLMEGSTFHISLLQSIASFSSLETLSMAFCKVNGVLNVKGFINFRSLTDLYMDGATIDRNFLGVVRSTYLEFLYMSHSGLNGTFPNQGLCESVQLQEVYIHDNELQGVLPQCFANLTSLHILDVSSNQFSGNIHSSPLKGLTSLQELRLSNNQFEIPISIEPFFNLSKLKIFYGGHNHIYAEPESHSLAPKFQLSSIILLGYGDVGTFPKFLYHQHDLHKVDLSHLNLTGGFPNWLLENNTKLEVLRLVNNSLSGPFLLPFYTHMHLITLDISINSFHSHIPVELATYVPLMVSLNFSKNVFNGRIPSCFGDMKALEILDLSNNNLSGEIPEHLATGCQSLKVLALSNNNLEGHIFSKSFDLPLLFGLQLEGNNFTGQIPESLSNSSMLEALYLSDNHLFGRIPRWLGNMSLLIDITMAKNQFEGTIPTEFCQLENLEVLDLSENNISGELPSCFTSIKQVHLSRNRLQGLLSNAFYNSTSLVTLDLSYNGLEGVIPNCVGNLSHLRYLILNNNNLDGGLPIQLCQLNRLHLINLSHNKLSGHIPFCLDKTALHEGDYDDLSYGFEDSPTMVNNGSSSPPREIVEFTTKYMPYSYQGRILSYMSGIDLSCNNLTGNIPHQIGNLTGILTLNFSHNNLSGSIPDTFSNLKKIESLDLSYNNLNGKIPPKLVEIYTLSVFSVAHNNLSGKTPKSIAQFATFGATSYEGNYLLCGFPLPKTCETIGLPTLKSTPSSIETRKDSSFIDMDIFYISFTVSYVIVLIGVFVVLYINPCWRQTWFYLVETWMISCYYFVVDNLSPLRISCHGNMYFDYVHT